MNEIDNPKPKSDRKPSSSGEQEITLINDPEHNIFYNAFTSEGFKARVKSGIRRVERLKAESGFSVVTDNREIVYTPLTLGGHEPSDMYERLFLGHRASVGGGVKVTDEWLATHYLSDDYLVIGAFHFHPGPLPFSNGDMEFYETSITEDKLEHRNDWFMGVFMPQRGADELINNVRLFMFSGPPKNTYYQAMDFSELRLQQQIEILERSGMKVLVVDLSVHKGLVDLNPLKTVLQ